jgi:hypothetical protein
VRLREAGEAIDPLRQGAAGVRDWVHRGNLLGSTALTLGAVEPSVKTIDEILKIANIY